MDVSSLSRFILLIVAVLNAALNMMGYKTIDNELANNVILVVTGFYTVFMAWKNNYLSKKGQAQKEVLERNGLK